MRAFLLCFLFSAIIFANAYETGNFSLKKEKEIKLENSEYRIKLFEPDHNFYMFYFGGTINNDYDHFGKIIKQNGFTNLGIEF